MTLLHVFEDNPAGATAPQHVTVRAAQDVLEDRGVEVHVRGDSGDPATVVQEVAAEVDADCIALGGGRRSPAGKAVFGSVTQTVLLSANRPVLVAGESDADGDSGE
ncbi:MAG: universal stress protein [Halolamina sp.]